jgi:hypothetical protein
MKDGQTIGQWLNWDFEKNGNLSINDKNGNQIYWENFCRVWYRIEFDSRGEEIYYEHSTGVIKDNRTPEVIEHNGRKYKLIP